MSESVIGTDLASLDQSDSPALGNQANIQRIPVRVWTAIHLRGRCRVSALNNPVGRNGSAGLLQSDVSQPRSDMLDRVMVQ